MKLPPFLMHQWQTAYEFSGLAPVRYNLAGSTGPVWSLDELLALGEGPHHLDLGKLELSYTPSEGCRVLRERVAEVHGVEPDWVTITSGAAEAMSVAFCLLAEPGASLLLPAPAFPAFAALAQAWGFERRYYTLARERSFALNTTDILDAVSKTTRLVLVNTPHSPTGSVMAGAEVARLAAELSERGIPLLINEVYHPLYFGRTTSTGSGASKSSSAASGRLSGVHAGELNNNVRQMEQGSAPGVKTSGDYRAENSEASSSAPSGNFDIGAYPSAAGLPNTIVIGDLSKAYSLSGLRIGWIIDRDLRRREQLIDLRSYLSVSSSPLSEALAAHALSYRSAILTRLALVARANLALLTEFMDARRDLLSWVPPAGGTVAFPWFNNGRDARPICQALAQAGVLFVPGDCFGASDHFRVGFAATTSGFQEALDIAFSVLGGQ